MERIALVTDSTCDETDAELDGLGVACVHLEVHTAEGRPLASDNEPATIAAFYDYLDRCTELPRTSMPTPLQFGELYSRLAREGYTHVLSVHIGSRLSGACQAARMGASTVPIPVEVVDCGGACWQLALIVRALAARRNAGASFSQLVSLAGRFVADANVCFAVDSMRNLVMGGRAGRAAGAAASLLDIKPLLMLDEEGTVSCVGKAKSMKRALGKLASIAEARVAAQGPLAGFFVHTRNLDGAHELAALFERRGIAFSCLGFRACGPVISTHVGTGCVGFAYITGGDLA